MIKEDELYEAIGDLEACENPTFQTCQKLATFYTIKNELYGEKKNEIKSSQPRNIINNYGDSKFLNAINGVNIEKVLDVIDELMETLSVINPRLYDGVMRKLK